MKTTLAIAALFSMLPTVKAAPETINVERMIEAITQVEGGRWGEPGGACCISYSAWSQHSHLAYQLSASREHAMPVYLAHYHWIAFNLAKNKIAVSPQSIGTAWRFGLSRAVKLKGKSDYGERCENLYRESEAH